MSQIDPATVFIPDGVDLASAFARVRGGSLGIGAHQDDLEIMAIHGIGQALGKSTEMFAGVTVTDGHGSPRKGRYKNLSDDQLAGIRYGEQNEAARQGQYAAQFQLGYASRDIKGGAPRRGDELAACIRDIILKTQPKTIYTHSPFDLHETHVAVTRATIQALQSLPADKRPQNIYGCEVWGSLDWLNPAHKVQLDVSPYITLWKKLIACHDSQAKGSKNYISATIGRAFANATYQDPRKADKAKAITLAVDLRPLVDGPYMDAARFVRDHLEPFVAETIQRAELYAPK
ncbi:MAG: LmbE family protein [Micavibrio sp.]|nr:LmbE family protein [Micavibrio sp.]